MRLRPHLIVRTLTIVGTVASATLAIAAAGCGQVAAGPGAVAGSWGRPIEVPGLRALAKAHDTSVNSVSCASTGNCAAGGDYKDGNGHLQGFVVSEKNGVWGQAIEVPGLGALNTARNATVVSVSCASAGNCAAGGSYTNGPLR